MTTKPTPYFPGKLLGIFLVLILPLTAVAQPTIWWTGADPGDDNWSTTGNWFDGTSNRLPTSTDIVGLGFTGTGSPNTAQVINLDIDTTIDRLRLFGDYEVELMGGNTLTILPSTGRAVEMDAAATENANLNTTINYDVGPNNFSTDAELIFGVDSVMQGTSSQRFNPGGSGTLRILAPINLKLRPSSAAPDIILNFDPATNQRFGTELIANANIAIRLESDARITGNFWLNAASTMQLIREGTEDRLFFANRLAVGSSTDFLELVEGAPGQGHLTFETTDFRDSFFILTSSDSTVRISSASSAGDRRMQWTDNPGLSGLGNFQLLMDASSHVFTIFGRQMDYTGRTMLDTGILRLAPHTEGTTTYNAALPTGTLLEISENAVLELNGLNQTVSGLTGLNGTEGTVDLGGGILTLDIQTPSTLGGAIVGDGGLVKSGPETLTIVGDYLSPVNRFLRVEGGEFLVQGDLSVDDGNLQLAGGLITADNLLAAGATWNVTLTAGTEGLRLADVLDADITGASLTVGLADGYDPALETEFTLLFASNEIAGASASDMFGFEDGTMLSIGSTPGGDPRWAFINWVPGSESIVLTIIPEPSSAALILLALATAFLRRPKRI